jgi:hypothetical protein
MAMTYSLLAESLLRRGEKYGHSGCAKRNRVDLCQSKSNYSDFILAGPLNLWFRNIIRNPEPRYIIITSKESGERLKKALCINGNEIKWGNEWKNVKGKLVRCTLYDTFLIEVLVDPSLGDTLPPYHASDLARMSEFVLVGEYLVRLAPLSFERALQESLSSVED